MSRLLRRAFERDLRAAALPSTEPPGAPVADEDLAALPAVVQRYLRAMDVVGRPPVRSFDVSFRGRFRMRPGGPWMRAEAIQRNSVQPIARVFSMVIWFAGALPMIGGDTYLHGRGRMHGRLLGAITVADGSGEEFDLGELSTWLNDAVLLAPSILLAADTEFEGLDDDRFAVTLRDRGNEVRATVQLDRAGRPTDHWTDDRWVDLPDGLVRAEWHTPVPGWTGGPDEAPMPLPGGATWMLADGPFTYVRGGFVPGTRVLDPLSAT